MTNISLLFAPLNESYVHTFDQFFIERALTDESIKIQKLKEQGRIRFCFDVILNKSTLPLSIIDKKISSHKVHNVISLLVRKSVESIVVYIQH